MLLAAGSFLSQMMLLLGMLLLAWVLIRRNLKMQRRSRAADREIRLQKAANEQLPRGAPLADAPKEVLRWQASMFDLQRDLKAELDTRISVVQSLLRQVDQRIDELKSLQKQIAHSNASVDRSATDHPMSLGGIGGESSISPRLSDQIVERGGKIWQFHAIGFSACEIAEKLDLPLAEVELFLGSQPRQSSYSASI